MGFSFVQATPNTSGTTGSMMFTLNQPSTWGTLLVATVSSNQGGNAFSSPGSGWQAGPVIVNGTGVRSEIWYYPKNPGNITSVTFTNGATGVPKGTIMEFASSPGTTQVLDIIASGSPGIGTSGTAYAAGQITSQFGADLQIAHFAVIFSLAPTGASWTSPGTGWVRSNFVSSSTQVWATYYQLSVPPGNQNVTGQFSTSTDETFWAANQATFTEMPGDLLGITDRISVSRPLAPPVKPYVAPRRRRRRPLQATGIPPTRHQNSVTQHMAIVDTVHVTGSVTIGFSPPAPSSTATGQSALEVSPASQTYTPPASTAFVKSTMPRLYLQNILTGAWVHRNVQNITQPNVSWSLNAAGTFTCTITPPRPDLMDSTGNPVFKVWQTAGYLEEADEIKWGGLLTQLQFSGPSLSLVFTEFTGYPNGMPYEGPAVSKTDYDALDAVRALWGWLQSQPNGNLGMVLSNEKSGVLLGQAAPFSATTLLVDAANAGDTRVNIQPPAPTPGTPRSSAFTVKSKVQVGNDPPHRITYAGIDHLLLDKPITSYQPNGSIVGQIQPTTPYTLGWWNSTDIGQEINSIQTEAVFDFRERHFWADAAKTQVTHRLGFGVPRIGSRSSGRFVEGENIVVPSQGTSDGATYANNIVAIGAGTGSAAVRTEAAKVTDRLRRTQIYTDQTVDRPDRLAAKARVVLGTMLANDQVTSVTVQNHPNAPFGTFQVGDDIPVTLNTGWRKTTIWSRITGMQQNPQTNQITLTLARSDSFSYLPQTGAAGSI